MRNLQVACLVGSIWCSSCSTADVAAEVGWTQVSVGGDIALASATGGVPASAGQDIGSAFGLGSDQGSPYLRGQLDLGPVVFTASAFQFSERGQGVLNSTFGGLSAATPVATELEFANVKLSGTFDIDLGPVQLSPGLGLDVFDFRFKVTETAFGNSEEIDEFTPVPMLFLRGETGTGIVAAVVEVGWLKTPEIDNAVLMLLDLEAMVALRFSDCQLFAGYRSIDIDGRGETETDSFAVDLDVSGWFVGGGVRF